MRLRRSEIKFSVTPAEGEALRGSLSCVMARDPHTPPTGGYFIRSLYFDDLEDRALEEKLAGSPGRRKVRLRAYDLDADRVRLEVKRKRTDFIQKEGAWLPREDALRLARGDADALRGHHAPPCPEVWTLFRLGVLRPTVVVDYHREAFAGPLNHTRITLDAGVRRGTGRPDFLRPGIPTHPVFERDTVILEVKFNGFLPDVYRDLLRDTVAVRGALSKYVLARLPQ